MGKRARKTRWRALDIADDHSDSEESNTNSSAVSSRYSHSNGYYSKYSYSSQSTPARRRYNQYDGSTKSTRSSSTTSENKITFNEDEYTRITTPRQDVLFKKGYLNKPKSFQTQTSTGNSTISTGNSTEIGTPDHQSTDLDYESQFLFPNGFVDQNGIYYVNSYEPYPLMLFNPPTYYQEFSNTKSKRYSTGSLSESMSPNNEEATSQDMSQSGGEASNSGVSDYSGGHVFNMVYPGYYVNGGCTPNDLADDPSPCCPSEPVKKLRKRRERKSSKTIPGDSSEYTDENSEEERCESGSQQRVSSIPEDRSKEVPSRVETPAATENAETLKTVRENSANNYDASLSNGCADNKTESNEITSDADQAQPNPDSQTPSVLKPDAEEFVPRVYHHLGPPPHLKMIPPNFMPIPLVPISDFGGQNFAPHPAFIPPGIPINFIPHPMGQKMFPPAPGYVSYTPPIIHEAKIEEKCEQNETEEKERESTATPSHTPVVEENKSQMHSKAIDIATVVSKLEAVKQQEKHDTSAALVILNENKPFVGSPRMPKPQNVKRNYYNNKYRNPPVKAGDASQSIQVTKSFRHSPLRNATTATLPSQISSEAQIRNNYSNLQEPHRIIQNVPAAQTPVIVNGLLPPTDSPQQIRNSPERFQKKSWKPNGYQNKNYGSPKRFQANQTYQKPIASDIEKTYYSNGINKNYSDSFRKTQPSNGAERIASSPAKVIEEPKPKSNNQWISVSSRKKKKNKGAEEFDNDDSTSLNDAPDTAPELFESYDITELVDVVPTSQVETQQPQPEAKRIEDILTSIAQTETSEVLTNGQATPTNVNIPSVSEIEKDIIVKIEETENTTKDETSRSDVLEEESFKPKKKSKKGTQKPLTKKVIITDIFDDLTVAPLEAKTPIKKIVKKIEEIKPIITEPQILTATVEPLPVKESTPEIETPETEQPEKKTKKKKKSKAAKSTSINITNSVAPDDAACNNLLEINNSTGEALEKTNEEISLELEKLIQKGMYSSLHEKIKTINEIPETDEFFKVIGSAVASPCKDKATTSFKAPDFNRIFQSTRQFLKPNMVSVEHDIKIDNYHVDDKGSKSCSSTADAADPSAGHVLDNAPEVQTETPLADVPEADKKLYPITQAVKEWMSKTREATPEVEILKSPFTIQREFGDNDISGSDLGDHQEDEAEEEITLFSSDEQPDLLEYWENDTPSAVSKHCDLSKDIVSETSIKSCGDGKSCDKCRTDSIKEGEEEIEIYESKYGRNEAFLHLQRELDEKQKETPRAPHLPHRAVCCSLQ